MKRKYLPQFDIESDAFDRLPRVCLARQPGSDDPIRIHRGAKGYYQTYPQTDVDRFNADRGITAVQVECMLTGSMFGWDVPGADPINYNDDGTWKKEDAA